ncbi:hypothetical protein HYH03_013008 [Edaphochlamys debaryana]|uniref:Uncharacterized protein n=1 Tax=Edaphochlamys debaryana TaxID=47281 RepID=A0A835XRT5_9CHLO|nr:hypothetical protein HYH03_013008 [Edaphochlamys debaryana]|eukprot:KAG2488505.1 hypothetical protein HYH03_013008 [Edaphochlamys debaryana]
MSDPNAAVNLCLLGRDGRAALHRISPVNDPLESRAHTLEMCQLIGPEAGADCSSALASAAPAAAGPGSSPTGKPAAPPQGSASSASTSSSARGGPASTSGTYFVGSPPPPPPPKRRFQEGNVDEICILLPELGPLSGVLVGVEGGTWYLDEMDVSSSRTGHMDRFVCRRTLGGRQGEGAAYLTPVPAGAVVYGEGETAVVLSKEQAAALWSINMNDYDDLKRRIAATTTLLVASGASLAALTGGTAAALPYTAGGVVGLVYQWLLMRGVDSVVEAASGSGPNGGAQGQKAQAEAGEKAAGASGNGNGNGNGNGGGVRQPLRAPPVAADSAPANAGANRILGNGPLRLSLVCGAAALGLALMSQEEAATTGGISTLPAAGSAASGAAAWQLALAALGFLTYKVAMVGVSLGDSGPGPASRSLGAKLSTLQGAEVEKYKRD